MLGLRKARVVPKARFETIVTTAELYDRLFCPSPDTKDADTNGLKGIEQHFHALIRERIGLIQGASEMELPALRQPFPGFDDPEWFPVPGMYGGFSYWFETPTQLICES